MLLLQILKINLQRLRSNGHFQFFTELLKLLNGATIIIAKVQHLFDALISYYDIEDETLKKIRKSSLTNDIREADHGRIRVFRGLNDANRSALNHYDPEVEAAAKRIQIVLAAYGNLSRLPVAERTSAIYNLVKELGDNHTDDAVTVGIDGWCEELVRRNDEVDQLLRDRFHESAERTDTIMRDIRMKIDEVYRVMMFCIEALWVMAPDDEERAPYENFIREWNAVVEYYNNLIAHRARSGKCKGDDGATGDLPDAPGASGNGADNH